MIFSLNHGLNEPIVSHFLNPLTFDIDTGEGETLRFVAQIVTRLDVCAFVRVSFFTDATILTTEDLRAEVARAYASQTTVPDAVTITDATGTTFLVTARILEDC